MAVRVPAKGLLGGGDGARYQERAEENHHAGEMFHGEPFFGWRCRRLYLLDTPISGLCARV